MQVRPSARQLHADTARSFHNLGCDFDHTRPPCRRMAFAEWVGAATQVRKLFADAARQRFVRYRFSLSPRSTYSSYVAPGSRLAPGRFVTTARRLVPIALTSHFTIVRRGCGP
jgi:hypothetical protein